MMAASLSIPNQISFRLHGELQTRVAKFHDQFPLIPMTRIMERALNYYLDHAEHGVDAHLNPIKHKKM
jgi:hypothetical protein